MGCDCFGGCFLFKLVYFNPRTRVGCDPPWKIDYQTTSRFQSTHPCGVRQIFLPKQTQLYNFNPRTRVGCDKTRCIGKSPKTNFNPRTRVGCDRHQLPFPGRNIISIHAPVWGATPCGHQSIVNCTNFNPRTRVGCDAGGCFKNIFNNISIHAPVWGATEFDRNHPTEFIFQSTHPCGVRQISVQSHHGF